MNYGKVQWLVEYSAVRYSVAQGNLVSCSAVQYSAVQCSVE